MGTDQAHEQINKSVKVNGGAIGILDNENALLEWSTASPVIAEILENFNDRYERVKQTPIKHHEETKNFEETFVKDRTKTFAAFGKFCNPFDEPGEDLLNIYTRRVFSEESATSVRSAEEIGKKQSSLFIKERNVSVHNIIHRNNHPRFRSRKKKFQSKAKMQGRTLKERCQLYDHLYATCASRDINLNNFFANKNHEYTVVLSDNGALLKPSAKSATIVCIESVVPEDVNRYSAPCVNAYTLDGAIYVHMHPPRKAVTYGEYCDEIIAALTSIGAGSAVTRLDVVFDVSLPLSRKRDTREARESKSAARVSVKENTPIVKDTKAFLASESNKTRVVCHDCKQVTQCRL